MNPAYGTAAVVLVVLATVGVGTYGLRFARTTSDFYVAARSVPPWWNASAIGGEYLSAASFLGVAGLLLAYGADMLWFPVGYTAGYLALLVLVAAPLRRSGAYTLPDFAELRLGSTRVRRLASVLVVLVGELYLLPQLQGAGLTMRTITGAPAWVGALLVLVVVVLNVLVGGMRSITFVQAFQYWLKLTALALPAVFLVIAWRGDGAPGPGGSEPPRFRAPAVVEVAEDTAVRVGEPVLARGTGEVDGAPVDGVLSLAPGRHTVAGGTRLEFPTGAAVPHAEALPTLAGEVWAEPMSSGRQHPVYATYSLLLALFFGTMGLPHVLVRFYTNPDGSAARRTTIVVLLLLGLFYGFTMAYGALARVYAPDLLLTGRVDAAVLVLPQRLLGGVAGDLLGALVAAGAFAAFLSTSSGLVVSIAGVLSQEVLGAGRAAARRGEGRAGGGGRVRDFRLAAVLAVAVPFVLAPGIGLVAPALPVADVVGLAFALAASSFCPLLVLGIWWRGLTAPGAVAGLVVGGGLAGAAVLVTVLGGARPGWVGALLAQPAAWSVPLSVVVMVAVSLATAARVPPDVGRTMTRLHAPEALGLDRT